MTGTNGKPPKNPKKYKGPEIGSKGEDEEAIFIFHVDKIDIFRSPLETTLQIKSSERLR